MCLQLILFNHTRILKREKLEIIDSFVPFSLYTLCYKLLVSNNKSNDLERSWNKSSWSSSYLDNGLSAIEKEL